MTSMDEIDRKSPGGRIGLLLFAFIVCLGAALPAHAVNCSDPPYFGVIDGDVVPAPSQIQIDANCTIRNFPASNPLGTNFSFLTQPGQTQERWLVIFDNVVHTGNMSCNATHEHKIWFTNGSSSKIKDGCQNLLIPVEKIEKDNPAPTAVLGVPFTYKLTIPVLFDPATDTVINFSGSPNDLHGIQIWDDLTETGADLTYVSHSMYWDNDPGALVPHSFSDGGDGKHLSFSFPDGFVIPAGEQIVLEITVVLDDSPNNTPGTQFVNTAKWQFGRLIDDVFYEPLPGEWGVTEPMTIVAPNFVVTKTGPDLLGGLNLGEVGVFTIDVWNGGAWAGDAFNVTVLDRLPSEPSNNPPATIGGMCDTTPNVVSVTLAGSTLTEGVDYTLGFNGAPTCELSLTLLDAAGPLGPDEHLIVTYETSLDSESENGAVLTNVAGAVQWFAEDSSNPGRPAYACTLTDGTEGVDDCQDLHQVLVVLSGYFYEKTAHDPVTGTLVTASLPGRTLRYRLRLRNFEESDLVGVRFHDDLGALNAFPAFVPGSLALVSYPAGADISNTAPNGGTNGAGILDVRNIVVPSGGDVEVTFDITLDPTLVEDTVVLNQASLFLGDTLITVSDDPNINGQANPAVDGDEDPTQVVIFTTLLPDPPLKSALQPTATIGEHFTYHITVPGNLSTEPLYDVRILDDLALTGADLRVVDIERVSGTGTWTPVNLNGGADQDTNLVIGDGTTGIDIPPGEQIAVAVTVELLNTENNVRPLAFGNVASYTYNEVKGDFTTSQPGGSSSPAMMTVVEPVLTMTKAVSNVTPGKAAADPADIGDVLEYALTITNSGDSVAYEANVTDILPEDVALVDGSATASVDGGTPVTLLPPQTVAPNTLIWGIDSGTALEIPVGGVLVLTYRVTVEELGSATIDNSAWVDWTSLFSVHPTDPPPGRERTGAGCGLGTVTSPNTYCYGPETASIATLDTNAIAKAVIGDTWDSGLSTSTDAMVRVGDIVTYELTLTLREGTTRSVSIQDVLDPGLAFVDVVSINGDATAPYSAVAPFSHDDITGVPEAGQTGTLTWSLGDVFNAVDGDPSNDAFVIVYRARVQHGAAEPPPATPTTTTLHNQATLSYTYSDGVTQVPLDPARMQDGASVEVRQPRIAAIVKGGTVLGPPVEGDGSQATPYVVNLVDNSMSFEVQACNGGDAPAYGALVTDQLAWELDETGLTTPVVTINGDPATAGVDYTYVPPAARGGQMTFTLTTPLDPGQCVTIGYDVGFHGDVGPNQLWSNGATLAEYWSQPPNDAREYVAMSPVEPALVWMTNVETLEPPVKVLVSPAGGQATIGEEVVYEITVPGVGVDATLHDVVVSDSLHPSLVYVGATAMLGGNPIALADSTSGNEISLGVGQIPIGQQVVIELRARVANNAEANAGVSFSNVASYTYAETAGGETLLGGSGATPEPLTIVEPLITIDKSAANLSNPDEAPAAGDVLRYTLTFTASTGAEFSDAFDLGIVDSLSLGLAYQPGTVAVDGAGNTIADPVTTGDGVTTPQTLTWDPSVGTAGIDVAEGETVTLTYDVLVLDGVEALQDLVNSATVQWTSLDGESAHERTGAGCPAITPPDDYCAGPATTTLTTAPPTLRFQKIPLSGATATPGDTVHYRLEISNEGEAAFSGFSLVDDIDRLNDPAMFVPGTLTLASPLPDGATNSSDPNGGTQGTGLIEIGGLSLGAAGSPNDTVAVEFTVQLVPVIANGTIVLNQAQLMASDTVVQGSDDPAVSGEQNPTEVTIVSAPAFEVHKVSSYVTGDPDVLLAGETLRYTITVRNVGTDHAADAELRDPIPVNTVYLAGSTTLNGVPVSDGPGGQAPLSAGLPINTPEDPTPGVMPADASEGADNVATIVFDVVVNADVIDGTVISNQAFVSAAEGGVSDQPSDDPRTPVPDDPTRDVVGNLPLLYATKSVALHLDEGSPNIVDPGDVLRYTITLYNTGSIPATDVVLTDAVPANTTWVANSLTLNGLPVGQPDGGVSPLVSGIAVSSQDLTPPLPGPGEGVLTPGEVAIVQFDLRVDDGVPAGTLISNQAVVGTEEVPNLLTDGDGNPSTPPQPTVVVVGDAQLLSIGKQVSVVGGGAAVAGATLEYVVSVQNIASVPAHEVVIVDDLDMPVPGQLSFVAQSATMNGSVAGVAITGSTLTASYSAVNGELAPGGTIVVRFRAVMEATLPTGTTVTNTAVVSWNTPAESASASVSVDVGGEPGVGIVNGAAWHDADFDRVQGASELPLEGWTVELYRDDRLVHTTLTAATGEYRISGLGPNEATGERYEIRFHAPGAGPSTALLGRADSAFTNLLQRIVDIEVASGANLQNLNLPITPNGVVYDSIVRTPIAGATLTLLHANSGTAVAATCLEDPAQQDQVTGVHGYYKFDIDFSDPACSSGDFLIEVIAPGSGFVAGYSQIIPPSTGPSDPPFDVPGCPGTAADAVPGTAEHCEAQTSEFAPPVSVRARVGTDYHVHLSLDGSRMPGSSQLFNNHIPLDTELDDALFISKTTPMVNVTRGQLVPYVITANNVLGIDLQDVSIIDRFPAGFHYVEGSARVDGQALEPVIRGRELEWNDLEFVSGGQHTIKLLLAVGAGVTEGEFVNRAQVIHSLSRNPLSEEATATVRLVPDPTFDCTDVMGKVFDDANRNGVQDEGERGIAGVRLVTARGLSATTDEHGRYHITCAITPREDRGSNFILKLDDRTLPSGFRASTDQLQVKRATRGKALRFNFGASIHRVVGLDIADAVFEPGSTQMRAQWKPRLQLLLDELRRSPAVLRLSYLADIEDPGLVERRLNAVRKSIVDAWVELDCCYQLDVEPVVFWRLGSPPEERLERVGRGR
jgi:large repetitive protein